MSIANVTTEWVNGNLVFKNASTGATLLTINATSGLAGAVAGNVTGNVTGNVIGNVSGGAVVPGVPFTAAAEIAAGDLLYISGWDATAGRFAMNKADCDATDPAKTAQFVAGDAVAQGAAGTALGQYELTGQNTDGATAVGDPVYLSAIAGGWSLTAPAGAGKNIQCVGVVTVKHASTGKVMLAPFYSKTVTAVA